MSPYTTRQVSVVQLTVVEILFCFEILALLTIVSRFISVCLSLFYHEVNMS